MSYTIKAKEFRVFRDDDLSNVTVRWCATEKDFISLHESDAAFGDTPHGALEALLTALEAKEQKPESEKQPIDKLQRDELRELLKELKLKEMKQSMLKINDKYERIGEGIGGLIGTADDDS